ncbi:septum formation protein Maf [Candidatus Sumerlaeota bacterium]|nr:septum formation protein Maf [Candidatus Sumerlaeota bacterium]
MSGKPRLILASNSPRRRDLLSALGLDCEVIPSSVDESEVRAGSPTALAVQLAYLKATDVAERVAAPAAVIGADTVVALGLEIFGKPLDRADAWRMLRALRGETHSVITGVALAMAGRSCQVTSCETSVTMRDFSDAELEAYIDSGEPLDKAGAYAIQGLGGSLIESHEGCWCNVVGLPLIHLLGLLREEMDVSRHPVTCRCLPWPHVVDGPQPWEK